MCHELTMFFFLRIVDEFSKIVSTHTHFSIAFPSHIGSIRYRMEIRPIEIDSKYASNNDCTISIEFNHDLVYVAFECMQSKFGC